MKRRRLLQVFGALGFAPGLNSCASSIPNELFPAEDFGNVTLFHITDSHAQLLPVYYREPSAKPTIAQAANPSAQLTGQAFLDFFGIKAHSKEAYAFTHLDFAEAASVYGKMGGYAHLTTLIKQLKQASRHGNFLLLDGGDSWQGSATSLWTQGNDMVSASNLLGVDVMTGHWEFTYGARQVLDNLKAFQGDFVAQNIVLTEEAQFAANTDSKWVFKPYVIKEFGAIRVAIIGQAYPYTPIANPKRFIPDWQFGIQEQTLQTIINGIKRDEKPDAVILLSHNGLGIDFKLAARLTGIDIILGGHTHDAMPRPFWVYNPGGRTCVTNAGSHGKFLGVLDLDIRQNKLRELRYRLLPVFSNLLEADAKMQALIEKLRKPYLDQLQKKLAVADQLLYRRDTFSGTFDQLLLAALLKGYDCQIAFSPGFRWGTSLLPGQAITYEDVMNQCAITYPNTLRRTLSGSEIKAILEDAADNVFNPDPYYQQGGDMVRVGGLAYKCNPNAGFGKRVSDLRLPNGKMLQANKNYTVASWASVGQPAVGKPMSEVLAGYLSLLT